MENKDLSVPTPIAYPPSAEFEGQIIMSTDGKHTVMANAKTIEGRKAAGEWVVKSYDWLIEKYGTKQELNKKTYDENKSQPVFDKQMCPMDHELKPMQVKKQGK